MRQTRPVTDVSSNQQATSVVERLQVRRSGDMTAVTDARLLQLLMNRLPARMTHGEDVINRLGLVTLRLKRHVLAGQLRSISLRDISALLVPAIEVR